MAQVDIVAAVGLTRERVRQLCDPGYRERALERRKRERLRTVPPPLSDRELDRLNRLARVLAFLWPDRWLQTRPVSGGASC